MKRYSLWFIVIGVALILFALWPVLFHRVAKAPKTGNINTANTNTNSSPANSNSAVVINSNTNTNTSAQKQVATKSFSMADFPERDPHLGFSANLPTSWEVEMIDGGKKANFYDPYAVGNTTLEQSQMVVGFYPGNVFRSVSGALGRTTGRVSGHPSVSYTLPVGSSLSEWSTGKTSIVEVQASLSKPYTYYVISTKAGVSAASQDILLQSLTFSL